MPFDESEPEPSTEPDSPNHTKFYGWDTTANYPGHKRLDGTESFADYYSRLASLNTGFFNGKWSNNELRRNADNLALFDAIANRLELTDYQHRVGREQYGQLNLSELSSPGPRGVNAELVAVMVAAVVCRADRRFYHPNRGADTNDPLFVSLIEDLGRPTNVVQSCYGKVLDRVNR